MYCIGNGKPHPARPSKASSAASPTTPALFGAMPQPQRQRWLVWAWKDFAFGTTARYVGDYRDDVTSNDVGDYWAIDMQFSYYWRKFDAKFTFGN